MSDRITLAQGKHLNLVRRGTWEFAHRPGITGIVGIIAVTAERELILVEQYRPPVDARVIELPAGLAGDVAAASNESLADAARRELLEEAGYHAAQMKQVAQGPASAGICDEIITLFLATDLQKQHSGGGDATEEITIHLVPLDAIHPWLKDQQHAGKAVDLKVYSGLGLLALHGPG